MKAENGGTDCRQESRLNGGGLDVHAGASELISPASMKKVGTEAFTCNLQEADGRSRGSLVRWLNQSGAPSSEGDPASKLSREGNKEDIGNWFLASTC